MELAAVFADPARVEAVTAEAAASSGWCGSSGTASGLSWIVVMAPATAAGADTARLGTTCSTPPAGRLSARPVCSAASALAVVPTAVMTKASSWVTARPERPSQSRTAACCPAVAPKRAFTWAGLR